MPRTTSTLRSGISIGPAGLSCGRRPLKPPSASMIGRLAGVGRRRHPGIDARLRSLGQRAEPEGRAQPVGRAVADHDQQHEHAEQQQRAQRERIVAVGARRGMADAQLLQQGGKALAVHAPQGRGAGVAGAQRQRVLIGGCGAMLDAGHRLDAADGLLARRPAHPHQRQQGDRERQREQAENDLVRQLGQPGPQPGQRGADEQRRPARAPATRAATAARTAAPICSGAPCARRPARWPLPASARLMEVSAVLPSTPP